MRPTYFSWTMAAADDAAICSSQAKATAGALTIDGTKAVTENYFNAAFGQTRTVANLDVLRYVLITSSGNDSGVTFTIVGTDGYNNVVTESIAGPNATTKAFLNPFKKVISVSVSAAVAGTAKIGTNNSAETPPVRLSTWGPPFEVNAWVEFSSGASLTWQWQSSASEVEPYRTDGTIQLINDKVWVNEGSAVTSSGATSVTGYPRTLIKGKITSFTGGTVKYGILKTT